MKWMDLTPRDFRKMAAETGLCLVPIGSLERHGEHIPFGCDTYVAETICQRAAELEPCVVFPGWYCGQVHEASCFEGTINFPAPMLLEMLTQLLSEIARNGFKKIVLFSGHGGNTDMLHFLDMTLINVPRDYTLYIIDPGSDGLFTPEELQRKDSIMETDIMGHADEEETSMFMACRPGLVHLEYKNQQQEPIPSGERMAHLPGVYSGLWWYAKYPNHVGGTPTAATEEKGRVLLDIQVAALARTLKKIKEDTTVPNLQKEFLCRYSRVGKQ